MMTNGRRVETGIDAAEENTQTGRNNVADRLFLRCEELFPRWLPRLDHDAISRRQNGSAVKHFVLKRDR
jgi:hypothetical protein